MHLLSALEPPARTGAFGFLADLSREIGIQRRVLAQFHDRRTTRVGDDGTGLTLRATGILPRQLDLPDAVHRVSRPMVPGVLPVAVHFKGALQARQRHAERPRAWLPAPGTASNLQRHTGTIRGTPEPRIFLLHLLFWPVPPPIEEVPAIRAESPQPNRRQCVGLIPATPVRVDIPPVLLPARQSFSVREPGAASVAFIGLSFRSLFRRRGSSNHDPRQLTKWRFGVLPGALSDTS